REAIRCLKRQLARRVWHLLQPDLATAAPTNTAPRPKRVLTAHCNRPTGILRLTYGDETAGVEAVMSGRARSVAVPGRWGFGGRTQSGQAALLLGLRAR